MKMSKGLMSFLMLTCIIFLLSSGLGVKKAYACSCAQPLSFSEAYDLHSHVFDGTVVAKKEMKDGNINVELLVSAAWKGDVDSETHVITANNSAACGYEFSSGVRYAVFAQEIDNKLHVSLCSNTTPIAGEHSDIYKELGEPKAIFDERNDTGMISEPDQSVAEGDNEGANGDQSHQVNKHLISEGEGELSELYSPDRISTQVTEVQLADELNKQQTGLTIVFVVVGVIPLLIAIILIVRRRMKS